MYWFPKPGKSIMSPSFVSLIALIGVLSVGFHGGGPVRVLDNRMTMIPGVVLVVIVLAVVATRSFGFDGTAVMP